MYTFVLSHWDTLSPAFEATEIQYTTQSVIPLRNIIHTMGATSGAGTAFPSGEHEFIPGV
jgi:hypothetical protein